MIAKAVVPDYSGGVYNEYEYEEYVFVSGYPVKFTGTYTATERGQKDKMTHTYRFNLESHVGKLTRNVTYETFLVNREDKGQTTMQTEVKSYNEKIDILEETYTLQDYQLSHATVADNRPAADFLSGNLVGRKVYSLKSNKNEKVTLSFSGRNVGYKNFWGATETQFVDFEYESSQGHGTIRSRVSDSKQKTLQYEKHNPSLSSFTGGHVSVNTRNMISQYDYSLPVDKGTLRLGAEMVPEVERYIVPKFRDLHGHWAKDNIEQLYSLGILEESSSFFSPTVPITRFEFTRAVMRAADIRVLEDDIRKRKTQAKTSIFSDLSVRDPDYKYIESAVQKGIISGVSANQFKPNDRLTRAQAITILVRALGFEERAPAPGYRLSYQDSHQIPYWAKDSIYVAAEIGLVSGDKNNRINPNQLMTRAEASAMLVRFLNFLEKDLQKEYRDGEMNR